jgi:DNA helicase-2/ATP-dependent DNA helicase PcrA
MEQNSKELKEVLKNFPPSYRRVATWEEGPLRVLTGPGSGKTTLLSARIAHLLQTSQSESFRVALLTLTNLAADELRARIISYAPTIEKRLFIGTFHQFCSTVLKQHGSHAGLKPDFKVYSSNDLSVVLRKSISDVEPLDSGWTRKQDVLLSTFQRLKADLVPPENAAKVLGDPYVASVYAAYEQNLRQLNALDLEGLISETVRLLTTFPSLSRHYRQVYPFICVDDLHEITEAQYRLLKLLLPGSHANVFAVADEDQLLYRFRGASPRRVDDFQRDFQPDVIYLSDNYRSAPDLVDLANRLIGMNASRSPLKPLMKSKVPGDSKGSVRLLHFDRAEEEVEAVISDILDRHSDRQETVAILARSFRLLAPFKRALSVRGVNVDYGGIDANFSSPPLIWLYHVLRLAVEGPAWWRVAEISDAFSDIFSVIVDPDSVTLRADLRYWGYLRQWVEQAMVTTNAAKAFGLLRILRSFVTRRSDYATFIQETLGWFDLNSDDLGITREEAFRSFGQERNLFLEALANSPDQPLEDFLDKLEKVSRVDSSAHSRVSVRTIHASKGAEFDHVYLIGMVEGYLPARSLILQKESAEEFIEDERKICFVGVTRAKRTLTLSFASSYQGRRRRPSRFLEEMGLQVP